MKKIVCALFGLFFVMPCFNARAYEIVLDTKNVPLDVNENMEVSWKEMKGPFEKIFTTKKDQETFFMMLSYDKKSNVEYKKPINVSAMQLYRVCIISVLTIYGDIGDETKEKCTTFAIDVAKNVLSSAKNKKNQNTIQQN